MAYVLQFFASQNYVTFFLALKSTMATIGNLDIVPQVSAWDQKLGTCVQNLPLRLTSFQISILHKNTLKQTR